MAAEIVLPAALRAVIEAAADAAWPEEACGLLFAAAHSPARLLAAVPVPNRAPAGRRGSRFVVDPAFHAALARRARAAGMVIAGAFHSHAQGPAALSADDRAGLPPEPGWITLVLGGRDAAGSWRIAAFRNDEPAVLRVEETGPHPRR